MRLGTFLLQFIPYKAAVFIAKIGGNLSYLCLRKRRQILFFNLHHICHNRNITTKEEKRYARQVFGNIALNTLDLLQIPLLRKGDFHKFADVKGEEWLRKSIRSGKGTMLITPHLGNWEFAGACLATLGYPIAAVAEHIERGVTQIYNSYRISSGVEVISPTEPFRILRALKTGKVLVLFGDRDLTEAGIKVNFLDAQRYIPKGPAYLASKFKPNLLIGYLVREENEKTYTGGLEPIDFCFSGKVEDDLANLSQLIADRISAIIKNYPEHWFVFQPEWIEE